MESSWTGLRDWRVVQGVERAVLRSWRGAGMPEGVRVGDMPQGGWTETAPLGQVNLDDLAGWMTVLIGDVADAMAVRDEAAGAAGSAVQAMSSKVA